MAATLGEQLTAALDRLSSAITARFDRFEAQQARERERDQRERDREQEQERHQEDEILQAVKQNFEVLERLVRHLERDREPTVRLSTDTLGAGGETHSGDKPTPLIERVVGAAVVKAAPKAASHITVGGIAAVLAWLAAHFWH